MVSPTQQTSRIRRRKATTQGKVGKRQRRLANTPIFPVHPEGYDPKAADARPAAKPAASITTTTGATAALVGLVGAYFVTGTTGVHNGFKARLDLNIMTLQS